MPCRRRRASWTVCSRRCKRDRPLAIETNVDGEDHGRPVPNGGRNLIEAGHGRESRPTPSPAGRCSRNCSGRRNHRNSLVTRAPAKARGRLCSRTKATRWATC
uniref:(northern house mosquito) hypothetical protein n=1 Tax=Culex pipiens TaxID=7175 RepID=A0A8D8C869_CULPI